MPRLASVLILFALFFAGGASAQLQSYDKSTASIVTSGGKRDFTVEVALTPPQQAQGLMFRREMAADAGMLFVFPESREQTFWMKNTYLPLDMIFIKPDGTILSIAERAVPLTETPVPSHGSAKAVLELNGGTAARLGIKPGDKVSSPALGR
jgi:uncharacterized membrane protein (UPF0127 family)